MRWVKKHVFPLKLFPTLLFLFYYLVILGEWLQLNFYATMAYLKAETWMPFCAFAVVQQV